MFYGAWTNLFGGRGISSKRGFRITRGLHAQIHHVIELRVLLAHPLVDVEGVHSGLSLRVLLPQSFLFTLCSTLLFCNTEEPQWSSRRSSSRFRDIENVELQTTRIPIFCVRARHQIASPGRLFSFTTKIRGPSSYLCTQSWRLWPQSPAFSACSRENPSMGRCHSSCSTKTKFDLCL